MGTVGAILWWIGLVMPAVPTVHEEVDAHAKRQDQSEQVIVAGDMGLMLEQKQKPDGEKKHDQRYSRARSEKWPIRTACSLLHSYSSIAKPRLNRRRFRKQTQRLQRSYRSHPLRHSRHLRLICEV
jgi:hypothetical protein